MSVVRFVGERAGGLFEDDGDGGVVADFECGGAADFGVLEAGACGGVAEEVVDAPAAIEFSGATAVGPPGVGAVDVAVMFADEVVPAALQQVAEPFAFMGKKTGRLFVGFGVEDVFFGVGDVDVAAKHEWFGVLALVKPAAEDFEPLVLDRLAFGAGGAGGEVDAGDFQTARGGFDQSAFNIRLSAADVAGMDFDGEAGPDGCAGISRAFSRVPDHMPAVRLADFFRELVRSGADFLQEQDIRADGDQMFQKSLSQRCSQTIHVPCRNLHQRNSARDFHQSIPTKPV